MRGTLSSPSRPGRYLVVYDHKIDRNTLVEAFTNLPDAGKRALTRTSEGHTDVVVAEVTHQVLLTSSLVAVSRD